MKKIAPLLFVLIFLLSCSNVYAVEFRSYKIIAGIEGEVVKEDFIITLLNDASSELKSATISAPLDSEMISVRDSYGDLVYRTSVDRSLKINFNFTIPVKPGEERLLVIKLRTKSLVTRKEDYFEYLLVFTPRQNISDFEHVLKLPSEAKLYSPRESFQMVVPETKLSEQYAMPTLVWRMELEADHPEVFLVRYKTEIEETWRKVGTALVVIIIVGVSGFVGNKAWKRYQKIKTIDSLKILNERERRVLEEIIKNEGIKQYELLERLEYTKTSLSKILAKLESRGLIKKKKIGKVNKLYPGEKIR